MRFSLALLALTFFASGLCAQQPEDITLKVVPIDASSKARLTSVRVDTMGRIFFSGYDTLFVCEPNERGGYHQRKLLYRFPERTWVNDIEVRGDDLYVLTSTALYVFYDGVRKREDLAPRKLVWGVPFARQDGGFQRLAWGPEGDLYISIGNIVPEEPKDDPKKEPDRLGYWTFCSQPEWVKTPYRGTGGIVRCRPDGSQLQVVAHGLYNPGYFTFDRHWNLFSGEYHQKRRGALWHVTPGARLGAGIGPADRLQPMYADEGDFRAGPTYYDDELLPVELRGKLLAVRYGRIWSFAYEPLGASFKATLGPTSRSAGPNIWAVGRGGRFFMVYESVDMITKLDDADAHPFEPYEASEATADKLWQELNDPSWQRRYRAHIEITRRGGAMLKDANKRLLQAKPDDPAMHHLIWLSARSEHGSLHLLGLVNHADAKVRVQALRGLTEFPDQLRDEPIFTKALLDKDPQVRHTAVLAHLAPKIDSGRAVYQAIERGPALDDDPYIRQTAALFLAQKATRKQIETLCAANDAPVRLAGVLAAGYRLTLPGKDPIAQQLPLRLDGMSAEVQHADGKRDLGRIGTFTIAEHWKADMHAEEHELLFKLLRKMLDDPEAPVRIQAAHFLALLDDTRCAADVARVLKNK